MRDHPTLGTHAQVNGELFGVLFYSGGFLAEALTCRGTPLVRADSFVSHAHAHSTRRKAPGRADSKQHRKGGGRRGALTPAAQRRSKKRKIEDAVTRTLWRPRLLAAPPRHISMPPRRSARLVELANPHFQLLFPPDVVALLFSLLPLDARLRAREVCRGWRFLLEDVRFWTHVDLSASCGVNPRFLNPRYGEERVALALLWAASVRAKGNLQSVDLSGVSLDDDNEDESFVLQWLDSASAADKASLRDLVAPTHSWLNNEQVTAVCRTVPLCRVRCRVMRNAVEVLPRLRREPPFTLLTIYELYFFGETFGEQPLLDLASALCVFKGMEKLKIVELRGAGDAVVNALVDAATSAGVKDMRLEDCRLSKASLPALARLFQSPGFEGLSVRSNTDVLFDGPALPAFCEALRSSKSLRMLDLSAVNLWMDVASASQLIAAMEGPPALQEVCLAFDCTIDTPPATQQAAGECVARLIARSSSLRYLHLPFYCFGEVGMVPIFQALRNSSLEEFYPGEEQISAEFACGARKHTPAAILGTRLAAGGGGGPFDV